MKVGHRNRRTRAEKVWREWALLAKDGKSGPEIARMFRSNRGKPYALSYIYDKIRKYSD